MHHFDIQPYLARVNVPTLVMAQTGSTLTSLEDQLVMRTTIPNSELQFIEDADGPHERRGSQRGSQVRIVEIAPSEPDLAERYARFLDSRFPPMQMPL